jgi:hypothetical protein
MGIEDLLKENNKLLKTILNKLSINQVDDLLPTGGAEDIQSVGDIIDEFSELPDANSGIIPDFNDKEDNDEVQVKVIHLGSKQYSKDDENNDEEEVVVQQFPPKILKINQKKVNEKKKPAKKVGKKKTVAKKKTGGKKQTGGKKPSAYQLFMKKQIPLYKKKNPKKSHREAFSAVAKSWKKQKN